MVMCNKKVFDDSARQSSMLQAVLMYTYSTTGGGV